MSKGQKNSSTGKLHKRSSQNVRMLNCVMLKIHYKEGRVGMYICRYRLVLFCTGFIWKFKGRTR